MKVARLGRRFYSSSAASFHGGEGEVLRKEYRFAQEEVGAYAALSGDSNPIHTLPSAAAAAGFPACVVHGMLCASLFPSLIRSHFPGAFFKSKTLRFKEPALVGDCLEVEARILSLHQAEDGLSVDFNMECYKKEKRTLVLEGKSTILVPNR